MKYERIRILRKEAGLTQKQAAEHLHITQSRYAKCESGEARVSTLMIMKLADMYGTSMDYIMGRTDEKKPHPKK